MRKAKLLGWILMTLVGSTTLMADPCIEEQDARDYYIVSLSDFNEGIPPDFFENENLVLECTEGMILPFKINMEGQFLGLNSEDTPLYLSILKTCYIRAGGPEILEFSTDLKTWKEFSEFFTGEIGATITAEKNPIATLYLELNERS